MRRLRRLGRLCLVSGGTGGGTAGLVGWRRLRRLGGRRRNGRVARCLIFWSGIGLLRLRVRTSAVRFLTQRFRLVLGIGFIRTRSGGVRLGGGRLVGRRWRSVLGRWRSRRRVRSCRVFWSGIGLLGVGGQNAGAFRTSRFRIGLGIRGIRRRGCLRVRSVVVRLLGRWRSIRLASRCLTGRIPTNPSGDRLNKPFGADRVRPVRCGDLAAPGLCCVGRVWSPCRECSRTGPLRFLAGGRAGLLGDGRCGERTHSTRWECPHRQRFRRSPCPRSGFVGLR